MDESTGVLTIETAGSCQGSANSVSIWAFLAPITVIHVGSMIVTNVILFKVKGISDRYQEQKYVALASIYICELLLLGLPILIAVQDSGTARYIVIAGVIFLTDTGVLALIFLPKIKYSKMGLAEGETVAGSMGISRTSLQSRDVSASSVEEIRRRHQKNGGYVSSVAEIRQRALASCVSAHSSVEGTDIEIPSSRRVSFASDYGDEDFNDF